MPKGSTGERDRASRRAGSEPQRADSRARAIPGRAVTSSRLRRSLIRRLGWIAVAALAVAAGLALTRGRAKAPVGRMPVTPAADAREVALQRAMQADPGSLKARLALGRYYQGTARPFEAMWEYAEAQRLAPADREAALGVAAVLRAGQVMDLALAQLTDAVRQQPSDLKARRNLAEFYMATADPKQARRLLEERRAPVAADGDALVMLGRARQADGDAAGAVAALKQALKLNAQDPEAWYRLGRCYLALGRSNEARDALTHAMFGYGMHPETPYFLGMTYMDPKEPGDLDRAISFFRDALGVRSNFAPAHYQYGIAEDRKGDRKQALSHYSFAILADTQYAEPNLPLARGLAAEGQTRDSHRYMARYYDLKDRPEEAVREFEQMGEAGSSQVALMAGQVLMRTRQEAKAVALAEGALTKEPDNVALLERLAVLKINRGDRPAARKLLQRWLRGDPKASTPCWLMGRCEMGDMRLTEAVSWLEKAIAIQPENPHYLGFLGAALMRMGTTESRERAAQVLAKSTSLTPENAEYRDLYAQVLLRLGRDEEARRQYLQALDADPFRISCFNPVTQLAWRLKAPGAGELFSKVTRSVQQRVNEENILWPYTWRNPRDTAGRLKLARFFCRAGELTKARDQLEQVVARQPTATEARQLLTAVERCRDVL
jgi:tetratricopeptide (TPR) repeat protein